MKYQITEKKKEEIERTRRKNKNKQIERRLKSIIVEGRRCQLQRNHSY